MRGGDYFIQANPPPGYERCPMQAIVLAVDGDKARVRYFPTRREDNIPVPKLLDQRIWRPARQEDFCESAVNRPCGACYGCVGYERRCYPAPWRRKANSTANLGEGRS